MNNDAPGDPPSPDPESSNRAAAGLPGHIEDTVRVIAKLHADHRDAATPAQRAVELAVARLGNPTLLAVLGCLSIVWIAANLALGISRAMDPPPFPYLELITTLASLGVMVLVLMTQRRDDQLARHREQLTLELAMLSERKLAKIIELLEESRRDNPLLRDRVDMSAEAMAEPADPESLGEAIKRQDG